MMCISHGDFTITQDNALITAEFIGSFNREAVLNYCQEVKSIVNNLGDTPFKMLINNTQLEGGTPDAYAELERFNQWMKSQSLVAKAYVFNSDFSKEIFQQRTPALTEQCIAFFSDVAKAQAWLNSH